MIYQDQNGNTIRLGQKIGGGGEAQIFSVQGQARLVAKIYTKATPGRYAKLRAMLAKPPADPTASRGHLSICWPTSLLFGTMGAAAGFLMPMMDRQRYREVFKLYQPQDRAREAPGFTWLNLVKAAGNIASVVQAIHAFGYVVGDINESNFFISEQTYVTLVDCDSMQVPDSGRIYRCTVGKADFTPPELQGRDFSAVDRTPEHDHFGLAVLIFLLLMEGVHPYSGVWKGSGDPGMEERIRRGLSPYGGSSKISPMPTALPFQNLPQSTRELFVRAFGDGHKNPVARPSSREWGLELRRLSQNLKTCRKNAKHLYPAQLRNCMWCERAALFGGVDLYPVIRQGLPRNPFPSPPRTRPQRAAASSATLPPYWPAPPALARRLSSPYRSSSSSSRLGSAISEFIWKTIKVCFALGALAVVAMLVAGYLERSDQQKPIPVTTKALRQVSKLTASATSLVEPPETWPADSVTLPVFSTIPGSDIRIESLQFFSAGDKLPPLDQRNLSNIFNHSDGGKIYWQLSLKHPEHAVTQSIDLVVYLYGPDGSLRARDKSRLDIEKSWTDSRFWNWWPNAISTWPIGEYSVSIFVNGTKVCADKFTIQPEPELTQAPSAPSVLNQPGGTMMDSANQPAVRASAAQQPYTTAYTPLQPAPAPETPLARYQAAHQVAGPDKQGILTLSKDAFRFDCISDRNPEQTFVVRREDVQSVHKNGVQLLGGKKYHFTVRGMTKDQVSDLFERWYRGR
ncbi:MAG TPA: hypothetical protein VFB14_01435 [Bryobacteraceae bacterium]|nr:hypothetical protein [Bryobacteraceae bacterium]